MTLLGSHDTGGKKNQNKYQDKKRDSRFIFRGYEKRGIPCGDAK
jgi:hypothetical protein